MYLYNTVKPFNLAFLNDKIKNKTKSLWLVTTRKSADFMNRIVHCETLTNIEKE